MDMATKAKGKPRIGTAPKRRYPDLHDHLKTLEKEGLLVTVDRVIDKDTEMHPLVRWQFRGGIAEKDRKAFLFNNVTDAKGKRYSIPVAVGVLASNREIYSIGMACALDQIEATWDRALPGNRHHRQGARQAGPGPRRDSDPDLDAGLGRVALYDVVAIHHQGSQYRHPEHGHLSRPGESAAAARHESVARAAARHLRALGKGQGERQEAAGRRDS